jgi:hypothetical protein
MISQDNSVNYDKNRKGKSATEEVQKLAQITELIELLEETPKSKDWILEQIRQNRVKVVARWGWRRNYR